MECPKGNDACLKIDLAYTTLKGCAKFSDVDTIDYDTDTKSSLENVCITDVSTELNKLLRETVSADEVFYIKRICACYQQWWKPDGCNGGSRNVGSLYPLAIVGFVTMKIFLG